MVRGLERVDQMFVLTMAAYNLTRMRTLGQIRLQGQYVDKQAIRTVQVASCNVKRLCNFKI